MSTYSRSPSPPSVRGGAGSVDGGVRSEDDERPESGAGGREEDGQREENSGDEEKKEEEQKKKKTNKPKGPVKRMVISDEMLTGTKGLSLLLDSFKEFEFKGKGKEKEDLNRILSKIEQWTHTLHPKHPFDQCLERIEFLGMKKKSVKTYLSKMRMGMLPSSDDNVNRDVVMEDEDNDFPPFENEMDVPDPELHELEERSNVNQSSPRPVAGQSLQQDDVPSLEEQMEMEEALMAEMSAF